MRMSVINGSASPGEVAHPASTRKSSSSPTSTTTKPISSAPATSSITCIRDGAQFSSVVALSTKGDAGTLTIQIGPFSQKVNVTAKTTTARPSATILATPQTCSARLVTSAGTSSKSAQSD